MTSQATKVAALEPVRQLQQAEARQMLEGQYEACWVSPRQPFSDALQHTHGCLVFATGRNKCAASNDLTFKVEMHSQQNRADVPSAKDRRH